MATGGEARRDVDEPAPDVGRDVGRELANAFARRRVAGSPSPACGAEGAGAPAGVKANRTALKRMWVRVQRDALKEGEHADPCERRAMRTRPEVAQRPEPTAAQRAPQSRPQPAAKRKRGEHGAG